MNTEKKSRLQRAWARVKDSFKRFWAKLVEALRGQTQPLAEDMPLPRKIGTYAIGVVQLLLIVVVMPLILVADKVSAFQEFIKDFRLPIKDEPVEAEQAAPAPEGAPA